MSVSLQTQRDTTVPRCEATRKLKFCKFGLAENPFNLHCVMQWNGRQLLGEILTAEYNPVLGQTLLNVRHFNREPWPIKPAALAVDIIG